MRSHAEIIRGVDARALAAKIDVLPGRVHQWANRNSIPGPYWAAIANAGLATLEELAEAVAIKGEDDIIPSSSHDAATDHTENHTADFRVTSNEEMRS